MASLLAIYNSQTDKVKAIIVFAITVAFGCIVFLLASGQMSKQAAKAMRPYTKSHEFIGQYIDSLRKPEHLPEKYFNVFKAQQKQVVDSIDKKAIKGLEPDLLVFTEVLILQ